MCDVAIENNHIEWNVADFFDGIYCQGGTISNNTLLINSHSAIQCTGDMQTEVSNNYIKLSIYGIYSLGDNVTIENNTIVNCANYGIRIAADGHPPVSRIAGNYIAGNGFSGNELAGGIRLDASAFYDVTKNIIENNHESGIIRVDNCEVTITNNMIRGNSSEMGGGIYCRSYANVLIAHNIICHNSVGKWFCASILRSRCF